MEHQATVRPAASMDADTAKTLARAGSAGLRLSESFTRPLESKLPTVRGTAAR